MEFVTFFVLEYVVISVMRPAMAEMRRSRCCPLDEAIASGYYKLGLFFLSVFSAHMFSQMASQRRKYETSDLF